MINAATTKSTFIKHVMALSSSAVLASIISFLTAPIMARLFTPESFGTAAALESLAMWAAIIACCRYEGGIMLPAQDRDAVNLVVLCGIIAVLVSLLCWGAVVIFHDQIVSFFALQELADFLWIIPLMVLTVGWSTALRYWFSRRRCFRYIALNRVNGNVLGAGVRVGGGLLGYQSTSNLMVFRFINNAISPAGLLLRFIIKDGHYLKAHYSLAIMIEQLRRYRNFLRFDTLSGFANAGARFCPPLLLNMFFRDGAAAGYYSRAVVLLAMPSLLVGQAISEVFFQRAASHHAQDKPVAALTDAVFKRLFKIGVVPFMFLIIVGPNLFSWFLGASWREAGVYAAWLTPMLLFRFAASPLSSLVFVLEKQAAGLIFHLVQLVGQIFALYLGSRHSAVAAVAAFSAAGMMYYGYLALWLYGKVKASRREAIWHIIKYLALSAAIISPSFIFVKVFPQQRWASLLYAALAIVAYWAWAVHSDSELKQALFRRFRSKQQTDKS